ncbi:MAG: hypothetical protein WC867_07510 [Candidatus Pacearchaeota archaeon]|jgi:hypothetical protein
MLSLKNIHARIAGGIEGFLDDIPEERNFDLFMQTGVDNLIGIVYGYNINYSKNIAFAIAFQSRLADARGKKLNDTYWEGFSNVIPIILGYIKDIPDFKNGNF